MQYALANFNYAKIETIWMIIYFYLRLSQKLKKRLEFEQKLGQSKNRYFKTLSVYLTSFLCIKAREEEVILMTHSYKQRGHIFVSYKWAPTV